ncbi:MAG: hypothetical protein O2816_13715 [Planctomycetota bacterium]|nr:hypothetical protein [Planctomycetota bacterium]
MRLVQALSLSLLALTAFSCQSASTFEVVSVDPEVRTPIFEAVAALEGRWTGEAPDGMQGMSEFSVTSGGSVVRETMMPGTDFEMTNMYALDGNGLVMTHYCAAGNQPHMRATAMDGNRIVFEPIGVSDLKATDEYYMGGMTLEMKDADHIVQHWQGYVAGEAQADGVMSIELTRVH